MVSRYTKAGTTTSRAWKKSLANGLGMIAVAAISLPALAAGPDLAKGKAKAAVCAACHGADGNSMLPINPNLAGQHPEYLAKQLRDFKGKDGQPAARANATMAGFAAILTEEDIKNVSAYFASQALKPQPATNAALVEKGMDLYRRGDPERGLPSCAGCHGPSASGIPARYPALKGQHAAYAAAQLTAFRQGERNNSSEMSAIARSLSDDDIKALAEYITGIR